MKKILFWLFAGLLSFTVSLAVLAPLPLVVQQIIKMRPELQFAGVSGSLWQGQVQRLTTPQAIINDLSWTLAPKKLLSGYLAADMEAEIKTVQIRGECGIAVLSQNLHCSPLRAEMDAANLNQLMPAGRRMPAQLAGNLIANLDDITWDRKQVPVANGRFLWDEGKIGSPIKLDLGGRYRANIEGDKDGNALNIELESQDTMVVLDGGATVEPAGRFDYEVFVKPAGTADPSIGAALEMIGAPQNDGSIRFKDKGELLGGAEP